MISQQYVARILDASKNGDGRFVGPCLGFRVLAAQPQDSAGPSPTNQIGGYAKLVVEVKDARTNQVQLMEPSPGGWVDLSRPARIRVVAPQGWASPTARDWWLIQYGSEREDWIDPADVSVVPSQSAMGAHVRGSPLAMMYNGYFYLAGSTMKSGYPHLAVASHGFQLDSGVVAAGALVTVSLAFGSAEGVDMLSIVADNSAGAAPRDLNLETLDANDKVTVLNTTKLRTVAIGKTERINVGPSVGAAGPADVYAYNTVLPPYFAIKLAAGGAAAGRLIVALR